MKSTVRSLKIILLCTCLGGLFLASLLPIGMFIGLQSTAFEVFFALHLAFHIAALLFALLGIARLIIGANILGPISLITLALVILSTLALDNLPIISRDALIHHLAVPRWWLESGYIHEISWHEWSYYPMLINLAYTGFLALGLENLTAVYHFSYLLIMGGVIACWVAARTSDNDLGLFALLLAIVLPIHLRLASEPLVDLGLGLYSFCAFIMLLRSFENTSLRNIAMCGIFLGLALSTKFNAMPYVVLLLAAPLLLIRSLKARLTDAIMIVTIAGTFALTIYSPWLIKNFAWTLNPLFPLFRNILGPKPELALPPGLSPLDHRILLYGESLLDISLIPLRMLFFGHDNNPRLFDGLLSPIILFGIIPIFAFKKFKEVGLIALTTIVYIIVSLKFGSARVRYLEPIIPELIVLASLGCYILIQGKSSHFRGLTLGILTLVNLLWSVWYFSSQLLPERAALDYYLKHTSKDDYLRQRLDDYAMIEYLNINIPKSSSIYLILTGNRFYYIDPQVRSSYNSGAEISALVKHSSTPEDIHDRLRHWGIDYIMAHARRTIDNLNANLTDLEKERWREFAEHYLVEVHRAYPNILYKIDKVR